MTAWAGTPRDMREALHARTGLPVACKMIDGLIAVDFTVLDGAKPWHKPFLLMPKDATPDSFLVMLDKWRANMQPGMANDKNLRQRVLGGVIAEYGEDAVREALAKRSYRQ